MVHTHPCAIAWAIRTTAVHPHGVCMHMLVAYLPRRSPWAAYLFKALRVGPAGNWFNRLNRLNLLQSLWVTYLSKALRVDAAHAHANFEPGLHHQVPRILADL